MITKNNIVAKALNAVGENIVGTRWIAKDDPLFIVRVLSESSGKVRVQSADGGTCTYSADEFKREYKLANSVRSRNAVVQKALNAAARNFTPTSEFEIGDKVRFRDSVRSVPHDETYTVVKVSGKNITIKGGRDNGTSTEFANNLEIVENADTSTISEKAVNANASRVFKPGEKVSWEYVDGDSDSGVVVADKGSYLEVRLRDGSIEKPSKMLIASNASRSTNAVVAKALNAQAVCNASYSAALKAIMDAVKPYMDRRITDDTSWRYPALVISKLRDVCERAVMSAGRYDGKRPPHRVYDVECVKDGFKFSGNLIVMGLLHRDDPDDVSAFDEYDMILSLGYAGKA